MRPTSFTSSQSGRRMHMGISDPFNWSGPPPRITHLGRRSYTPISKQFYKPLTKNFKMVNLRHFPNMKLESMVGTNNDTIQDNVVF